MENNYVFYNLKLEKARFDFELPRLDSYSISIKDKVIVSEIRDNSFSVRIGRLVFVSETDLEMAMVVFSANVKTDNKETKESIEKNMREDKIKFAPIFSKISTVIAQTTMSSAFGPLVTMPMSDTSKIDIQFE